MRLPNKNIFKVNAKEWVHAVKVANELAEMNNHRYHIFFSKSGGLYVEPFRDGLMYEPIYITPAKTHMGK